MAAQEYITDKEAAAILKVHVRTVRRLIVAGKLPASDLGTGSHHLYRIKPDDIASVPAALVREPTPPRRRRRRRHQSQGDPPSKPLWP